MITLDLKDAYLQIPIHQDHQHLQFQWMERIYQFLCLPFGLTSAPRVFTKVLKPLVGTLRQMGIRLVVYLDNILILHQDREEIEHLSLLICNFFEALGLVINTKKSLLIPQQSTEFLRFLIRSVTLQIQMPRTGEAEEIQKDNRELLQHQSVTVWNLARFVGKTVSGRPVCFSPDSSATQVLQLENRCGGRGSGCIQTGLVTLQEVCQSPVVFNPLLPQSSSCSEGQANTVNPSVAIPSVVPSGVGGHTLTGPKSGEPHLSSPGAGISNAPGIPQPSCIAYLWETFSS